MVYQIKIQGQLDESWSDWLGNARITSTSGEAGSWTTTLIVEAPDPPALFGILDRLRDLNLPLVLVKQINPEQS